MKRCLNDRAFGLCVGTPEEIPVKITLPWWRYRAEDWDGTQCVHNARTCPYYRDAREELIRKLEAK